MSTSQYNPYETRPENIPQGDMYGDIPNFGRYYPRPDEFCPDLRFANSNSPEAAGYWASVLADHCKADTRIYENIDSTGSDVFAVGSVIIKSSHLRKATDPPTLRDFSYVDKNEVKAADLARDILDVRVPKMYFSGEINGRHVLVQERIPGIGLNVAWQYLNQAQKDSFKQQARNLLRQMSTIQAPSDLQGKRSYVSPDPDPIKHKGIQQRECDILFGSDGKDESDRDTSFMHNDVSCSNCIVDNDKIVALIDWEMAGFFGWKTAGNVHSQIRGARRENYEHLNLSEDFLADILFWNDLYEEA